MESVRTSETSVFSNDTIWRYIPEDSKLHTRRRKNLKSHIFLLLLGYLFSCTTLAAAIMKVKTVKVCESMAGKTRPWGILKYVDLWSLCGHAECRVNIGNLRSLLRRVVRRTNRIGKFISYLHCLHLLSVALLYFFRLSPCQKKDIAIRKRLQAP
jgi:hypothetical protein